ncbi:MAG: hypothetical protein AAGI30_08930 [Planctomycetota bacterium]
MNRVHAVVAAVVSSASMVAAQADILSPSQDGVSLAGFQAANPGLFTETFDSFAVDGVGSSVPLAPTGAFGALGYTSTGTPGAPGDFDVEDGDISAGVVAGQVEVVLDDTDLTSFTFLFPTVQTAVGITLQGPGPSFLSFLGVSTPGLDVSFDGAPPISVGSVLSSAEVSSAVFVVFEDASGFDSLTFTMSTPTSFIANESVEILDVTYLVPAPGALGLAGLAGVCAGRRRR